MVGVRGAHTGPLGKHHKCPRPADQTPRVARASGQKRCGEPCADVQHQLGRAQLPGWAQARWAAPGRPGAGLQARVPAESERGAEQGASSSHSTPRSPADPGLCQLYQKQGCQAPGAHPPGTKRHLQTVGVEAEPVHPSPCLCTTAVVGPQRHLENPPPASVLPAGGDCGELLQVPPWAAENYPTPGKVLPCVWPSKECLGRSNNSENSNATKLRSSHVPRAAKPVPLGSPLYRWGD